MNEMITARDLAMVTSDIQYAQRQGARQLASNLIEIGRLLVEAKTMVEPRNWKSYIWDNFGYKTTTADNWMKLYREYGDGQESLFDSFRDSQTFGKLSYTQLLALTALPAEERSAFVEENDVENMSTRQLQQAIRERDEALRKLRESEEKQVELEGDLDDTKFYLEKAQGRTAEIAEENKSLQEKVKDAKKAQSAAEAETQKLKKKLAEAETAAKKAAEDAKAAAEDPEIPEAVMEQMRRELEAEAAKKAAEDLQKELSAAQKKVEEANAARTAAEEKLAAHQKASTMANPNVAVFKSMVQQVKADFDRLKVLLDTIRNEDPETGDQLKPVALQLLQRLKEEL